MNRLAHYLGHDHWNQPRTATMPLRDDATPPKTIVRIGVRMELQRVEMIEHASNECADWIRVASGICHPVTK